MLENMAGALLSSCLSVERPALRSRSLPFTGAASSCPCFGFGLSPSSDSDAGSGFASGRLALFVRRLGTGSPQSITKRSVSPVSSEDKHTHFVSVASLSIEQTQSPFSLTSESVPVYTLYNARLRTQEYKRGFGQG